MISKKTVTINWHVLCVHFVLLRCGIDTRGGTHEMTHTFEMQHTWADHVDLTLVSKHKQ